MIKYDKILGNIQFRSFNGNERMRIISELHEPKNQKRNSGSTY
jgi:hypothetical protein